MFLTDKMEYVRLNFVESSKICVIVHNLANLKQMSKQVFALCRHEQTTKAASTSAIH